MTLQLAPVHIRLIDRTGITAEDEAQTLILATAIIKEMLRIGMCISQDADQSQTTKGPQRPSNSIDQALFSPQGS